MERGDIADFAVVGQSCIFEGLLAHPPHSRVDRLKEQYLVRKDDWAGVIGLWKPNELPLKSLIDSVKRLGIATDVITFLSPDAVEPIYQWLIRKGVSTSVYYYESAEAYADDLKYDWSIRNVFCADQETAFTIGMRATVVSNETTWSV